MPAAENSENSFENSIGIQMRRISAGSFLMGNPDPRIDAWDEAPVHQVSIGQPFYISESEVTVEQYQQFRSDYAGPGLEAPAATGISWHEANAFCKWLSEKEGKPYRLPTEAEWEYAARAGTDTPYWSGDKLPAEGEANPWGLINVHSGAREWCLDWYGLYPAAAQTDPIGPKEGMAKVIRGGGLDSMDAWYARSRNRAGYAPAFAMMQGSEPAADTDGTPSEAVLEGLAGVWYGDVQQENPKNFEVIRSFNLDWSGEGEWRGNEWSARWSGVLIAPASGAITFHVASDGGATVEFQGQKIIDWEGEEAEKSASVNLVKGERYPIAVSYYHDNRDSSYLKIQWSAEGEDKSVLSDEHLRHSPQQEKLARRIGDESGQPGHHAIGFRVVQAPLPDTSLQSVQKPFVQQCAVQSQPMLKQAPDPNKPWFRKRPLLPMPPDNRPREESREAGFFPGMMPHNHSPALEVMPNGDVLMIIYTSESEYEPEVSLIANRLRFGSEQWDMPEKLFDFPDVNDHAPCLYTENDTVWFFWGNPRLHSAYPFQWVTSADSGASWSAVHFPQFVGEIGPHSRQPINSVLRDDSGTLYVSSDGIGGNSVLWATDDNGETWYDAGGRSGGRHTTYAMLKDGRILGMGGKNTDIDGYMPKSISNDGGATWELSKTPFSRLGSNQRPTLIRLQSGRLFFAGDFQHRSGEHPEGIKRRGSYVALSEDEGETWRIKKLAGTQPHESDDLYDTLGYSVARQAPNGIIHLISTMNTPCLHFELNEAWILDESAGMQSAGEPSIQNVETFSEHYPSGQLKAEWSGGLTPSGEYRLHGSQIWHYENGQKQWQVEYDAGRKVGTESHWTPDGTKDWQWVHNEDGSGVWTQYWPNGRKKSESHWKGFVADGTATRWDRSGEIISNVEFTNGRAEDD